MGHPDRKCPVCFSATLGQGVGLAFPPANTIFAGIGVLLSAANDVGASQAKLIDLFNCIERFFGRLEIYTGITPTTAMRDIIVEIMVEVLTILAIATKEVKCGRLKKYFKKLTGNTDIEDSLARLDKLTQEEARIASAELLKMTHSVDSKVMGVDDRVKGVEGSVQDVRSDVHDVGNKVQGVEGKVLGVDNKIDQVNRNQLRDSFYDGSRPQIHPLIITLHANLTTRVQPNGFSRKHIQSVEIHWLFLVDTRKTGIRQKHHLFFDHTRSHSLVRRWEGLNGLFLF
ncbi:hypothetical protein BJV77DRAFT_728378 [Russula vinacea]|nr:hypothetical protein BJV77DRAFT_728378 [Russula vinacea]